MEEYTLPISDCFVHPTAGPMFCTDFGEDRDLFKRFIGGEEGVSGKLDREVILNGEHIRLKKVDRFRQWHSNSFHLSYGFLYESIGESANDNS